MASPAMRQQLEELFRMTGQEHHRAFEESDGADPDWPLWYAEYLHDRIDKILDARLTKSELVYLIVSADRELTSRAPGVAWPRFYARYFTERYS